MNSLLLAGRGSAFLKGNFDQHLIRASMVIIFLLFGYQKWFAYESQELIPFVENGPLISWLYPVFGIRGGSFFGRCGVDHLPSAVLGRVEQVSRSPWGPWFLCNLRDDPHNHSFYAKWMGRRCRGLPCDDRQHSASDKGRGYAGCFILSYETGCCGGIRSANRPIRLIFPIKQVSAAMAALGLLRDNLEYYVLRTAMVIIFAAFGYTKWHPYAAHLMVPFISNSPFIFWLYPAFGFRGASRFLGASDWTMFVLLYAGFWDKQFGVLGSLGATGTFITTVTIIPFIPNGWDPVAGFPAMTGDVPFLAEDVVLLAVAIYLLKHDLIRLSLDNRRPISSAVDGT